MAEHQPGENAATGMRLAAWRAMQFMLSEPPLQAMFDNVLTEALKHYPAEEIKAELRSVGISDEQLAQAFGRIGQ